MSKKKIARIAREIKGPNERCYHFTTKISDWPNLTFNGPFRISSGPASDKTGEIGKKIVKTLLPIDGVVTLEISLYRLRVVKASLFDWNDIESEAIATLQQILDLPKEPVEDLKQES